ncbi:hypothetical protein [Spirosoma sp. KUDC1026]|uniref:hypothetical protein n=1 Tax=Spirosoma sp. KUDC1026 TaxID=2745947 RepID=UPI00159BB7A7|nr:hypothetical protein [Spirosoma sp. KUDC1026]QKZ13747.1 hypothetical protein HU175_14345 [Spirosoma sp. KUDC1026]
MKPTAYLILALVVGLGACSSATFDPLTNTYGEEDAFKGLYDARGYSLLDDTSMVLIARAVKYNQHHQLVSEGKTFGTLLKQGQRLTRVEIESKSEEPLLVDDKVVTLTRAEKESEKQRW